MEFFVLVLNVMLNKLSGMSVNFFYKFKEMYVNAWLKKKLNIVFNMGLKHWKIPKDIVLGILSVVAFVEKKTECSAFIHALS